MKLAPIALKYGSDKCRFHSYGPVYDELFEARQAEVKNVLEIGIGYRGLMTDEYRNGASLYMWAEYFPNARIFGLDIRPDALVNEGRIQSRVCDQGSLRSIVEAFDWLRSKVAPEDFDLIADDGSHEPEHQVLTANALFNACAPHGGRYIIEDVRSPEYVAPFLFFPCEVRDLDVARLYDDRMIISL